MPIISCPFPCRTDPHSQSQSKLFLHSESSSTISSISSQPSLPSVPSLTPPSDHHPQSQPLCNCVATFRGHSSALFSLALSSKFLCSGSSDSEIRLWCRDLPVPSGSDYSTSPSSVVAVSNAAVKSLLILDDKLFSAHQDHKIRIWKINTTNLPQKFKCVAILPTLTDRLTKFLSAKNYVEIRRHKKCTWVHHVDTVSALAISKDGKLLYSASWDRTFKIWRTRDFKCLESVGNAHDDAINAVILGDDGLVYTGSADKKIKVWGRNVGEKRHTLLATLERHKSAVNALAISADGSVLYSGACDRSILVWERESGGGGGGRGAYMAVGALRGHCKAILCLTVVSAELVCSGSADCTVRIWRRGMLEKMYSCMAVLEGHKRPVKCLTVTVESNSWSDKCGISYLVYSGSLDCDIKVWQIRVLP